MLDSKETIHDAVQPVAVSAAELPASTTACISPDEETIRELRLFRAHLRESLDRAIDTLRVRIAQEILGRELLLAPADVTMLVAGALADYEHANPLRVRVHPDDVVALSCIDLPVFGDETLTRGDAYLDLRSGCIDLTLMSRLDDLAVASP
ncbi:MAG: FliH/SctL family protein [Candidatus Eremiobacteraeota bacterium]|nr:FliH/SctL family protein [Candidatus Eremiobacteraeota bacterium]